MQEIALSVLTTCFLSFIAIVAILLYDSAAGDKRYLSILRFRRRMAKRRISHSIPNDAAF